MPLRQCTFDGDGAAALVCLNLKCDLFSVWAESQRERGGGGRVLAPVRLQCKSVIWHFLAFKKINKILLDDNTCQIGWKVSFNGWPYDQCRSVASDTMVICGPNKGILRLFAYVTRIRWSIKTATIDATSGTGAFLLNHFTNISINWILGGLNPYIRLNMGGGGAGASLLFFFCPSSLFFFGKL